MTKTNFTHFVKFNFRAHYFELKVLKFILNLNCEMLASLKINVEYPVGLDIVWSWKAGNYEVGHLLTMNFSNFASKLITYLGTRFESYQIPLFSHVFLYYQNRTDHLEPHIFSLQVHFRQNPAAVKSLHFDHFWWFLVILAIFGQLYHFWTTMIN